jgi:uncharacterized membrane protein
VAAAILVEAVPVETSKNAHQRLSLWQRLRRILRHRWIDERDVRRAVPPELLSKLERYVAASEARHSGEIRICIEAGLPMSYLWRDATPRERAIAMFGKLRVWDTAANNGVLIYLLLAENAIEIVADRAINTVATASLGSENAFWQERIVRMRPYLQRREFEAGLTLALEEISALMMQHFPLQVPQLDRNELPNAPDLR